MGTFDKWAQFYAGKILGLASFYSEFVALLREEWNQTVIDLHGAGGTFGSVGVSFTYAAGKLTIGSEYDGVNAEGNRMTYRPDDVSDPFSLGFEDVPFQDTAATAYHVGAGYISVPARAAQGSDGALHWDANYDAIGKIYTPDSVANLGGGAGLRFVLTAALSTPTKWSGAGKSRPVRVWKVDPVTDSAEAVADGTLELSGGTFRVDIAHYFGQAAASPSTTAAHYRVAVLGPVFATSSWVGADDTVIQLGSVNTGVWSATGAPLLYTVGDWILAFGVEHYADGTHEHITADSVTIRTSATAATAKFNAIGGLTQERNWEYQAAIRLDPYDISPYTGGWVVASNTEQIAFGAGPPPDVHAAQNAVPAACPIRKYLHHYHNAPRTSDTIFRIVQISARIKSAAQTPAITLYRKARANDADAGTVVATMNASATGAWVTNNLNANHDVADGYVYWVEIGLASLAGSHDAEVGDVWVTYEKRGIE